MLKKIQQDFSYYSHEFKDNYRKGVHRLRTILASRAQAQAFVSNAGGVAVVLGYEPDKPDKNAQELYALLMASPYIDDAVQTFLGSIYEAGAESQDVMYSDSARCLEILHDPVMARAAGAGAVSAGKWIAALAGQSCNSYRDITAVAASATAMNAVAASATAMTAVAASETAMAAVVGNATALNAVVTSQAAMNAVASSYVAVAAVYESAVAVEAVKANETAWSTLTGASSAVMGKAAAKLAGLNPADYADMDAIAASSTAMAAIASSSTAMAAIIGNSTALNAVVSSSTAMAAIASSSTAMAAIASSSTAMAAIIGNSTALNAVVSSSTAMAAIIGNSTALNAVVSSSTAMAAIASSSTAMAAVASSKTAATAIEASSTAVSALSSSPLKVTDSGGYGHTNNKRNVRSGRAFIISVKFGTSSNTSYYGNISTFLLGSSSYRATCNASARAINRFATSIVCYGEYTGSLNDNVNYSQVVYIPC